MIKSMTAFARYQQSDDCGEIIWEIKSVNHRFLEPQFRLPEDFRQLEPEIRSVLAEFVSRGKVDLSMRYTLPVKAAASIKLNKQLVKDLREVEKQVLTIVHEGHSLAVADILKWPGVVEDCERDFAPLRQLAVETLKTALQQLLETRLGEGEKLRGLLETRCKEIQALVAKVRQRRPQVMEAISNKWQATLTDKLSQWGDQIEPGRLEQELVLLAQKMDVDEELDRLDLHVSEVLQVLQRDEPVGRRLDFLMQELNREANTLSSKAQDAETTAHAVDLKVLIEQMREQVQNIE